MYALSFETREAVDATVKAGEAAGSRQDGRPPIDLGWMYNRQIQDPDGHMDMSGMGAA